MTTHIETPEFRAELADELARLQSTIGDDYRADEFSEEPSMQVTLGIDREGGYALQTGDNSYTGAAYGFPYWGVGTLTRDNDPADLADWLIEEALDQLHQEEA